MLLNMFTYVKTLFYLQKMKLNCSQTILILCFQRPLKFEVFRNCHRNVHTVLSLSQFCLIIVSSSNLIKNVPKELIGKKTSVFYILTYLLTVRTAINFHPERYDFYPSLWMESDITTHHWVFENSSFCVLRIFVPHEYLLTQ